MIEMLLIDALFLVPFIVCFLCRMVILGRLWQVVAKHDRLDVGGRFVFDLFITFAFAYWLGLLRDNLAGTAFVYLAYLTGYSYLTYRAWIEWLGYLGRTPPPRPGARKKRPSGNPSGRGFCVWRVT